MGVMNKTSESQRVLMAYRNSLGRVFQNALDDDDIVEVYRNPDGKIWTDSLTKGREWTGEYMDESDAEFIVDLVANEMKKYEIGNLFYTLEADMPITGERFQALLPPIVKGIQINIRKKIILVLTIQDYVARGIMTQEQADYLIWAVETRKNIGVGGSTGAGKTTLANALTALPGFTKHRIVQIEDRSELQCDAPDIVRILTKEADPVFTTQQAIVACMRLRPDRFVVGEIREGAPALALAKASNTGHPGCIATMHCDSAEEAYDRMDEVISEVTTRTPHRLIRRTLAVVVHIERRDKEGFKVSKIVEPIGYDKATETYITREVANTKQRQAKPKDRKFKSRSFQWNRT